MMTELPNTDKNVALVQDFLDETMKRISQGTEITFTSKANNELNVLALSFDIEPK
jgi:hypothetical protein